MPAAMVHLQLAGNSSHPEDGGTCIPPHVCTYAYVRMDVHRYIHTGMYGRTLDMHTYTNTPHSVLRRVGTSLPQRGGLGTLVCQTTTYKYGVLRGVPKEMNLDGFQRMASRRRPPDSRSIFCSGTFPPAVHQAFADHLAQ